MTSGSLREVREFTDVSRDLPVVASVLCGVRGGSMSIRSILVSAVIALLATTGCSAGGLGDVGAPGGGKTGLS